MTAPAEDTPAVTPPKPRFGLSREERAKLLSRLKPAAGAVARGRTAEEASRPAIDPRFTRFADFPAYKQLRIEKNVAQSAGILNPFFQCHDGIAKAHTSINGETFLNFSTYDYLDLMGHPEIAQAATDALERWGTGASASRLVSGERPPHRALEKVLASLYGTEDAMVYVSGHATNVSTIGKLFGPNDVIFHDSLSHNSIVLGAQSSGARRISYPHNDCEALRRLLLTHRASAERCLIVTEGVFSMDGNIADMPGLVALKKEFGAFLMVDEAHALGVLGKTGKGTAEHFGLQPGDIDITMGTLSKTCCTCGGYIAGSAELIELLKFTSPGFVYSVGMSPVLAAASAKAIEIMLREPERVQKLQHISHFFVQEAKRLDSIPVTPKAMPWCRSCSEVLCWRAKLPRVCSELKSTSCRSSIRWSKRERLVFAFSFPLRTPKRRFVRRFPLWRAKCKRPVRTLMRKLADSRSFAHD